MTRVLLLTQFYPPVIGGEERHVRDLAIGLAARGHEVHVGTLETPDTGAAMTDPGVEVHTLANMGNSVPSAYADGSRPYAPPVPDPLLTRALGRLAKRVRPDVVHAHNWIVNSYLPIKSRHGAPLVLTLHDYGHLCATRRMMRDGSPCPGPAPDRCVGCAARHYGKLRGPVIWGGLRGTVGLRQRTVDRFLAVSSAVATASGLQDSGASWEVLPNFVPDQLLDTPLQPRAAYLPTVPYLFFAGDLGREKGLLTLLDSYSRMGGERPALLAVGRPAQELPTDVPAGVSLVDGWPHERIVAAFQHCLAAVLPSEWPDPCPTTVLEAMALGAPLVTTAQGGIVDMVENESSALVVEPGDVEGLTKALHRITSDEELRERLRAGARQAVSGFTQERVVDRLEQLYSALAAQAPLAGILV